VQVLPAKPEPQKKVERIVVEDQILQGYQWSVVQPNAAQEFKYPIPEE
jgi:hypothetical protein